MTKDQLSDEIDNSVKCSQLKKPTSQLIGKEGKSTVKVIDSTENKKNIITDTTLKRLERCDNSYILLTSFSPRVVGVQQPRTFMSLQKPQLSTIPLTPSVSLKHNLTELNDAEIGLNKSMHCVDLTTPIMDQLKLRRDNPFSKRSFQNSNLATQLNFKSIESLKVSNAFANNAANSSLTTESEIATPSLPQSSLKPTPYNHSTISGNDTTPLSSESDDVIVISSCDSTDLDNGTANNDVDVHATSTPKRPKELIKKVTPLNIMQKSYTKTTPKSSLFKKTILNSAKKQFLQCPQSIKKANKSNNSCLNKTANIDLLQSCDPVVSNKVDRITSPVSSNITNKTLFTSTPINKGRKLSVSLHELLEDSDKSKRMKLVTTSFQSSTSRKSKSFHSAQMKKRSPQTIASARVLEKARKYQRKLSISSISSISPTTCDKTKQQDSPLTNLLPKKTINSDNVDILIGSENKQESNERHEIISTKNEESCEDCSPLMFKNSEVIRNDDSESKANEKVVIGAEQVMKKDMIVEETPMGKNIAVEEKVIDNSPFEGIKIENNEFAVEIAIETDSYSDERVIGKDEINEKIITEDNGVVEEINEGDVENGKQEYTSRDLCKTVNNDIESNGLNQDDSVNSNDAMNATDTNTLKLLVEIDDLLNKSDEMSGKLSLIKETNDESPVKEGLDLIKESIKQSQDNDVLSISSLDSIDGNVEGEEQTKFDQDNCIKESEPKDAEGIFIEEELQSIGTEIVDEKSLAEKDELVNMKSINTYQIEFNDNLITNKDKYLSLDAEKQPTTTNDNLLVSEKLAKTLSNDNNAQENVPSISAADKSKMEDTENSPDLSLYDKSSRDSDVVGDSLNDNSLLEIKDHTTKPKLVTPQRKIIRKRSSSMTNVPLSLHALRGSSRIASCSDINSNILTPKQRRQSLSAKPDENIKTDLIFGSSFAYSFKKNLTENKDRVLSRKSIKTADMGTIIEEDTRVNVIHVKSKDEKNPLKNVNKNTLSTINKNEAENVIFTDIGNNQVKGKCIKLYIRQK